MIIRQEVKDFEQLGFGMFVHFGLYSQYAKGEWAKLIHHIPDEEYEPLAKEFCPRKDWAKDLVAVAKGAGCKYITLTTRHHDGYSLFDTCGLSDYDAPHSCGRDLIREFVDACRAQDIIPFFYHTLIDWHEKSFYDDFPTYLKYLRDSVKLLCTNYGKIGGLWFDGKWAKPNDDWEEDELYGMIRRYQPESIIINNTGMVARGQTGHIELDSVTFERGMPDFFNSPEAPKYLASEMCEVFGGHWGYAEEDLGFSSSTHMIETLANCRRNGANMLLNVGPKGDGSLRTIDVALLEIIGQWVSYNEEAIRKPRPTKIVVEGNEKDFILQDGDNYYLFCFDLPSAGDANVVLASNPTALDLQIKLDRCVLSATWMDNGEAVQFEQEGDQVSIHTTPYPYGRYLVVRVAKLCTKSN